MKRKGSGLFAAWTRYKGGGGGVRQRGHSCGHVDYFMWEEFPSYRISIHVREHERNLSLLFFPIRELEMWGLGRLRVGHFTLKFFAYCRKIHNPESFIVLFFTLKISAVIFIGEGLALSRLQNDLTSNIWWFVPANTTFSQKLVVERRRLPRHAMGVFPPKWRWLTQEHYILSIEKILYS